MQRLDAGPVQVHEGAFPGAALGGRGRGPQPGAAAVGDVDAVRVGEVEDVVDGAGGRLADAAGLGVAADGDQAAEPGPHRHEEARVAAARAAAADVGLDEDDVGARGAAHEVQGRPQAGEPAAHDQHVAAGVRQQRGRAAVGGLVAQGVGEPARTARGRGGVGVGPGPGQGDSGHGAASTVGGVSRSVRSRGQWRLAVSGVLQSVGRLGQWGVSVSEVSRSVRSCGQRRVSVGG